MSETEKHVDVSSDSGFDEETDENDSLTEEEMVSRQDDHSDEDTLSVNSRDESSNDELRRIENDRYTSGTDSDDRENIVEFFRRSDEDDESDSDSPKMCLDEEYATLADRIDNVLLRVMRKPKCFTGARLRSKQTPISKKL